MVLPTVYKNPHKDHQYSALANKLIFPSERQKKVEGINPEDEQV
jgi:hypothetical protein